MNRLLPILCILALAGAGALGYLRFQSEKARRTLQAQLGAEANKVQTMSVELEAAKEESGALTAKVRALESDLGAAKANLASATAKATQLDNALSQARATLAVHEQNAKALATELATLRRDLEDTRAANASPEAIATYKNTIAELERQLASVQNGAAAPSAAGASTAVFASRPGRAMVVTVGPGNAFVVLNYGADRGAALGQRMTVSQGTDVVATVLISDVRPNFSIAQVLPDTLRGVLQKGDSALLIQ
jgi:septal ring factor EnvC (AmiA/AmiB activator)